MGKSMKLLTTRGSPDRPFPPELEEAEEARLTHEIAHSGHKIKVRTFRSKCNDSLKREFWAVRVQYDSPPGAGKSHIARARAKANGKAKAKVTAEDFIVNVVNQKLAEDE